MKESNNIYVIQRDRDKKFYGWEGNWVKTLMEAREYNHVPGNFHKGERFVAVIESREIID